MKTYNNTYIKSCMGYSTGSYSHYYDSSSFQILKEGKVLGEGELCRELQKLEQGVNNLQDKLKDTEHKLQLSEVNVGLLQDYITELRKTVRNNKSELSLSEASLTRAIASHYETEAKLKALQ